MTSPTQRSLKYLRDAGWICQIVERFNPHVGPHGIRQDLFGGIDLIAIRGPTRTLGPPMTWKPAFTPGCILGVQACGQTGHAAHKAKLLAEPRMREWLDAGGRLWILSWRKLSVVKKDGTKGKVKRYECRQEELTLEHFDQPGKSVPAGVL
jgi:hypothetical protein